jgi:alkyldihydroxyacetonephosphate synthase
MNLGEIRAGDLKPYRSDWWALSLIRERRGEPDPMPAAAFKPRSAEEVAEVIKWAAAQNMPVVARGGGSGVCGAAAPGASAVVIDLTAMDRVVEIDPFSLVVTAEAGVTGPALEAALDKEGMTLGHVPQSFHLSTLGGWISTKAIGQFSTRYGGIEDRVLGLQAVLPSGEIVLSKPSPRSSTGPDWWRMFVGAEGTLGVVTQATLSAFPRPMSQKWVCGEVPTFKIGFDILRVLLHRGLRPAVARLYDQTDASLNFGRLGISAPVAIFLFEGPEDLVAAETKAAETICHDHEVKMLGPEPGEHWMQVRFHAVEQYRKLLAGQGALGPFAVVDTMEVSSFWGGLAELYDSVKDALAAHADGVLAHASHLYTTGANIYFTFLISSAKDEADAEARYLRAWEAGMKATLSKGGSISHHHGIGALKSQWMEEEHGSGMNALRRIKEAFDPGGMMNPGKLGL